MTDENIDRFDKTGRELIDVLNKNSVEASEAVVIITTLLASIHKFSIDMPYDIFWKMVAELGMQLSQKTHEEQRYDG